MTTEEQVAAEAAAKAAAGTADAGTTKDAAYWEAEARKAIADRDKAKAKVRELEPLSIEGQKALDAKKTAEQRLAEVERERDTYKVQAEESTAAMTTRLAAEIAAIPEAMRGLVPDGLSPAKQLEWIGTAQAAGVFGVKSASPGAELHGGRGGATVTEKEFVESSETKRKAMRQQVAEGKLTVVPG